MICVPSPPSHHQQRAFPITTFFPHRLPQLFNSATRLYLVKRRHRIGCFIKVRKLSLLIPSHFSVPRERHMLAVGNVTDFVGSYWVFGTRTDSL